MKKFSKLNLLFLALYIFAVGLIIKPQEVFGAACGALTSCTDPKSGTEIGWPFMSSMTLTNCGDTNGRWAALGFKPTIDHAASVTATSIAKGGSATFSYNPAKPYGVSGSWSNIPSVYSHNPAIMGGVRIWETGNVGDWRTNLDNFECDTSSCRVNTYSCTPVDCTKSSPGCGGTCSYSGSGYSSSALTGDRDFIRTNGATTYNTETGCSSDRFFVYYSAFLTFIKPTPTLTGSAGSGCVGMTCTPTAVGTYTITMTIPAASYKVFTMKDMMDWSFTHGTNGTTGCNGSCDMTYQWSNGATGTVPGTTHTWTITVNPDCGDGIREGTEACDLGDATHGNGNGTACPKLCSNSCTVRACSSCGDGVRQTPNSAGFNEQCDLGAGNGSCPIACSITCLNNPTCVAIATARSCSGGTSTVNLSNWKSNSTGNVQLNIGTTTNMTNFWYLEVPSTTTSTNNAPIGFAYWSGAATTPNTFSLVAGTTYYVRAYYWDYGSYSNTVSFVAGNCCGDGARQTPNTAGFSEECDLGDATHGNGNGAWPKTCNTNCTTHTYCGDGVRQTPNSAANYMEQCDAGDSTHGNGNGTCAQGKLCSATCANNTCCTARIFSSGSISPSSVSAGGSYTAKCDYGVSTFNSTDITINTHGNGSCTFVNYSPPTTANFNCTAGAVGAPVITCELNSGSQSNCPDSRDLGTLNVVASVDHATPVTCNITPTSVTAGSPFTAQITMSNDNTSTKNWTTGYSLKLIPSITTDWGKSSIDFVGSPVAPGGNNKTFTDVFTAPNTTGDYDFIWQMHNGSAYFDDVNSTCGLGGTITVTSPGFSLFAEGKLLVEIGDSQTGTINSNKVKIKAVPDTGFTNAIALSAPASSVTPVVIAGFASDFVGADTMLSTEYNSGKQFYVTIPKNTSPGTRKVKVVGTAGTHVEEVWVTLEVTNSGYRNE